jgi:hypothetical protein
MVAANRSSAGTDVAEGGSKEEEILGKKPPLAPKASN